MDREPTPRERRLAERLRANLGRRKAQARAANADPAMARAPAAGDAGASMAGPSDERDPAKG